jgi:hypothetical protein
MGLFDKRDKKRGKDDFDSPVEQIDLAATPGASPPVRPEPSAAASPEPAAAARPAPEPVAAARPRPAPPVREPVSPDADDYGIDKAIELMRTLPSENVELVVQVVKFSLESVGIKLPTIIDDAIRRQKDIQGRIGVLKGEIADLEQEIKVRKEEIERLDADFKETSTVRERLELAEQIGKPKPDSKDTKDTRDTRDARPEPIASSSSSATSLPRVTKQTAPPPLATSSPMSQPSGPGTQSKK